MINDQLLLLPLETDNKNKDDSGVPNYYEQSA